jgi:cysteinyl-tRNA synthetase
MKSPCKTSRDTYYRVKIRFMGLRIYNTLSGKKEEFIPIREGEVRMYVCGVTVYDSCHIGHARALLTFDVIYRYLRFLGFQVLYVRNFTDLDDKIIQRAKEKGTTAELIAEKYIQEFYRDSTALGLLPPAHEPKATEHIPEIIVLIRRLEDKGMAYRVNGDLYFPVDLFPGYGKLSRRKLGELEAGARVEIDERKRSPMDFALWKESKEGEPSWESPWGKGRPGWHIECSAMSTKYLGQPFDIHGGGGDLVFPHHENEIAQTEAATGAALARYWIHNGFLNMNQEKMSKSLGNIIPIRDALERHEAAALRHYFFASHYRSPMDFSLEGFQEAESGVTRIFETLERSKRVLGNEAPDPALLEEFRHEMGDDFNTPRVLALMFEEVRSLNRLLDEGKREGLGSRRAALETMAKVLGLMDEAPDVFLDRKKRRWLKNIGMTLPELEEHIRVRDRARSDRRWEEADRIRKELQEKGITLEDTPEGTLWNVR